MASHINEALTLAETAGYTIVYTWKTRHPRRVGKGLLKEITFYVKDNDIRNLIFYGDIQPSSRFQLMKNAGVKVLDRVMLILEIFAKHAGSREAKLQIEMARIRHEIPMIRELIRRSKMGEYPGFLGPGGYAVDSYYRHLTRRLSKIRKELEELRRIRGERFRKRARSGLQHVSIIGYASAGKTSLFNRITRESKEVGPEYFTTLHPKHKAIYINGVRVAFVDTVGFIRDVPPEVIEAFYSTLEEITMSDIALFVLDLSEPMDTIIEKLYAGLDTLGRIEAHRTPLIIVGNKIDLLDKDEVRYKLDEITEITSKIPQVVRPPIPVSANTGQGLDSLLKAIVEVLTQNGSIKTGRII